MYNPVAQRLLKRILTENDWGGKTDQPFVLRLTMIFQHLHALYQSVYGDRAGWEDELKDLVKMLHTRFENRPAALRKIDSHREENHEWFISEKIAGMMLYTDRFNGTLKGVEEKLPYFESLGINLLHLMPLFKSPPGKNDGGYAVSDYRQVDKKFGTTAQLKSLASKLHKHKMFLMLDLVINHTSDEHEWAQAAKKGDQDYQAYYHTFGERTIPDLFERSLPEVFPENAPGNFTWSEEMGKWVMTVFNTYQWDLNYANPRVLNEMIAILLDVANMGVDIFRLDAVAFLWKKMGTNSQNLEEAHILLRIMKCAARIVAPGVAFLAEAIVAPHEILRYFGESKTWSNECDIAYNATLMALMWDAVSTKNSRVLRNALSHLPHKPEGTTWINYLRCHDDIGLGYDNADIHQAGYSPSMHRRFMVDFLTGQFEGSFARGLPFMTNPQTGDARISGSLASLAGLEEALAENDEEKKQLALSRILMMHGVMIAWGGIPMIYYGDELATLNDYSFADDPSRQDDNRWVHRPVIDWDRAERRHKKGTAEYHVFTGISNMLAVRSRCAVMGDHNNVLLPDTNNDHVFVFARMASGKAPVLIAANLTGEDQYLEASILYRVGLDSQGLTEILTGNNLSLDALGIHLKPYQVCWLTDKQL